MVNFGLKLIPQIAMALRCRLHAVRLARVGRPNAELPPGKQVNRWIFEGK